jgi:16S rRNA (cytosine1402-N4)-methyltransferase
MKKLIHTTVLLQETIVGLNLKEGDIIVDCTLGSGGHIEAVCKNCPQAKMIIGLDADSDAIARSKERLKDLPCSFSFKQTNYSNLSSALDELGVANADKYIFDLGFSSDQLEASGRGFSFLRDEPLIMTLADNLDETTLTAKEIVNTWLEESIADIIYGYGEERYARRIAKKIIEARETKPIETTFELVEVIKRAVPFAYQRGRLHFATRTFQALRITVNNEIENVKKGLTSALTRLNPGGRIVVISFHSIEDRVVKHFFRDAHVEGVGNVITKKPIVPSDVESRENPRARSSKLRIFEKK